MTISTEVLQQIRQSLLDSLETVESNIVDCFEFGDKASGAKGVALLSQIEHTLIVLQAKSVASLSSTLKMSIEEAIATDDEEKGYTGFAAALLVLKQQIQGISETPESDDKRIDWAQDVLLSDNRLSYAVSTAQGKQLTALAEQLTNLLEMPLAAEFWQPLYQVSKEIQGIVQTEESYTFFWLLQELATHSLKAANGESIATEAKTKQWVTIAIDYLLAIVEEGENLALYEVFYPSIVTLQRVVKPVPPSSRSGYNPPPYRLITAPAQSLVIFPVSDSTLETIAFAVKKEFSIVQQIFEARIANMNKQSGSLQKIKQAIRTEFRITRATFKILNFSPGIVLFEQIESLLADDQLTPDSFIKQFSRLYVLLEDALALLQYKSASLGKKISSDDPYVYSQQLVLHRSMMTSADVIHRYFKRTCDEVMKRLATLSKTNFMALAAETHQIKGAMLILKEAPLIALLSDLESAYLFLSALPSNIQKDKVIPKYLDTLAMYEVLSKALAVDWLIEENVLQLLQQAQASFIEGIAFDKTKMAVADYSQGYPVITPSGISDAIAPANVAEFDIEAEEDEAIDLASPETTEPEATEPEVGESQVGETQVGETQVGETQIGETRVSESQTGETQIGETQIGETQIGETQIGETQIGETQIGESQTGESQTGESQVGESQVGESQVGESQVGESQVGESQIGESQVGESQVGESQVGESQVGETQVGESQAAKSEMLESPEQLESTIPKFTPSPAQSSEFDSEILEIFLDEAKEVTESLSAAIPDIEAGRLGEELLSESRRSFHTLKGSGRMVGLAALGDFAEQHESLLKALLSGERKVDNTVQQQLVSGIRLASKTAQSEPFVEAVDELLESAAAAHAVRYETETLASDEAAGEEASEQIKESLPTVDKALASSEETITSTTAAAETATSDYKTDAQATPQSISDLSAVAASGQDVIDQLASHPALADTLAPTAEQEEVTEKIQPVDTAGGVIAPQPSQQITSSDTKNTTVTEMAADTISEGMPTDTAIDATLQAPLSKLREMVTTDKPLDMTAEESSLADCVNDIKAALDNQKAPSWTQGLLNNLERLLELKESDLPFKASAQEKITQALDAIAHADQIDLQQAGQINRHLTQLRSESLAVNSLDDVSHQTQPVESGSEVQATTEQSSFATNVEAELSTQTTDALTAATDEDNIFPRQAVNTATQWDDAVDAVPLSLESEAFLQTQLAKLQEMITTDKPLDVVEGEESLADHIHEIEAALDAYKTPAWTWELLANLENLIESKEGDLPFKEKVQEKINQALDAIAHFDEVEANFAKQINSSLMCLQAQPLAAKILSDKAANQTINASAGSVEMTVAKSLVDADALSSPAASQLALSDSDTLLAAEAGLSLSVGTGVADVDDLSTIDLEQSQVLSDESSDVVASASVGEVGGKLATSSANELELKSSLTAASSSIAASQLALSDSDTSLAAEAGLSLSVGTGATDVDDLSTVDLEQSQVLSDEPSDVAALAAETGLATDTEAPVDDQQIKGKSPVVQSAEKGVSDTQTEVTGKAASRHAKTVKDALAWLANAGQKREKAAVTADSADKEVIGDNTADQSVEALTDTTALAAISAVAENYSQAESDFSAATGIVDDVAAKTEVPEATVSSGDGQDLRDIIAEYERKILAREKASAELATHTATVETATYDKFSSDEDHVLDASAKTITAASQASQASQDKQSEEVISAPLAAKPQQQVKEAFIDSDKQAVDTAVDKKVSDSSVATTGQKNNSDALSTEGQAQTIVHAVSTAGQPTGTEVSQGEIFTSAVEDDVLDASAKTITAASQDKQSEEVISAPLAAKPQQQVKEAFIDSDKQAIDTAVDKKVSDSSVATTGQKNNSDALSTEGQAQTIVHAVSTVGQPTGTEVPQGEMFAPAVGMPLTSSVDIYNLFVGDGKPTETETSKKVLSNNSIRGSITDLSSQTLTESIQDAGLDLAYSEPSKADSDILSVFLEEAKDIISRNRQSLGEWQDDSQNLSAIQEIQRGMHTLKGGAGMAELSVLSSLAHDIESLLDGVAQGRISDKAEAAELLKQGLAVSGHMVDIAAEDQRVYEDPKYISQLDAFLHKQTGTGLDSIIEKKSSTTNETSEQAVQEVKLANALQQEKQQEDYLLRVKTKVVNHLSRLVGDDIIMRAQIERVIEQHDSQIVELSHTVQRVSEQIKDLETEAETQILSSSQDNAETGITEDELFDALEMDHFSEMQQLSHLLSESIEDLYNISASLQSSAQEIKQRLIEQNQVQRGLQSTVLSMTLVRFDSITSRLQRLIDQILEDSDKSVILQIVGGDIGVERQMLEEMTIRFEHVIRNAIAHGIESPERRQKLNKSPQGTITLTARQEGTETVFVIADDGRGFDFDSIRQKAESLGWGTPEELADTNYLLQLPFSSGFTTLASANKIAGRGIGLDVLHNAVLARQGRLAAESLQDKGLVLTIRLPFLMTVTDALIVKMGHYQYAIPVTSIQGVGRLPAHLYTQFAAGQSSYYQYGGDQYKIESLVDFMDPNTERVFSDYGVPVLLASIDGMRIAFIVEELGKRQELVVNAVNRSFTALPGVIGAAVLDDGVPVPVAEITLLGRHFLAVQNSAESSHYQQKLPEKEKIKQQLKVLVVDDSVTMRKMTTKLLQQYDCEVQTAKDGLDAVNILVDWVPELILLDVEMPRMDGFELARHVRNLPQLSKIPIIMITSRTGDKHRTRAEEIGVNGYLGKPYTKEVLVEAIETVLGTPLSVKKS